jgi:polyhydroxyalkanoate synthesis regulator phasin
MKIVEKLSTYAALIGVIGAIGGGFYTWGQFNTRLDTIEKKKFVVNQTVDLNPINNKIATLEVKLIDRIGNVEDKIKPTDLSGVKKDIAKIREEIAALDIPKTTDLGPLNAAIKELEDKISKTARKSEVKEINTKVEDLSTAVAIVQKENQLQDILIEEIKEKANNPLAN